MDKLDVEERQKISSLQREKKDAASGVGWMYKGDKPESEEYLLGKRIDKHVEGEEDKKEDEASVIFGERIKANIALDVAAKMREDPLFAIRRKEDESRKKLLENPIRMKELQKLINQQEKEKVKKEKKSRKHKKKDKKKKKKRKGGDGSSQSGSDDESDEETDIMEKYLSILTSKHGGEKDESSQGNPRYRDGKNNFRGNMKRDSRGGRSRDQGWERDGRDREANGDRRRTDRRGENDRDDKFEMRRERGEEQQRNRDRDREGSPRWHRDRDSGDYRDQRRSRGSPDSSRPKDNFKGRDKQRVRKSESPDDRGKHRKDIGKTGRGREDKEKELPVRKGRRSLSLDSNGDGYVGKERREESIGKYKTRNNEGSRSKREGTKRKRSTSSSSSSSSAASSTNGREVHRDTPPKQYGLIMSKSAEEAVRARRRSRSSSSPSGKKHKTSPGPKPKPVRRQPSPPRRKLTEEEKQRRLEEMMENAEWREDQREINVKKYREEDRERERKDNNRQSSGFISSLMVEHASSSSVEDRIRRNKYNIQRTRKDLDKNFTQK